MWLWHSNYKSAKSHCTEGGVGVGRCALARGRGGPVNYRIHCGSVEIWGQ